MSECDSKNRQDNEQWFLVLDGALKNNIKQALYEYSPDIEWLPLYLHTNFSSLLEISPLFMPVTMESGIMQWYAASQENSRCGILISSTASFKILFAHLQSILTSRYTGQEVLFRFYDPVVIEHLYAYLTAYEKQRLLGPAQKWCWKAPGNSSWSILPAHFQSSGNEDTMWKNDRADKQESLVFTAQTLQQYAKAKEATFIRSLMASFQEQGWAFDDQRFQTEAVLALQQARTFGLTYSSSLATFVLFWMAVSTSFYRDARIHAILQNPSYHELEKVAFMSETLFAQKREKANAIA